MADNDLSRLSSRMAPIIEDNRKRIVEDGAGFIEIDAVLACLVAALRRSHSKRYTFTSPYDYDIVW
jgi:hypothetical protein